MFERPAWFYVALVVITLGVWLALGRGWQPLLIGFILGTSLPGVAESALAWRRRGMESTR